MGTELGAVPLSDTSDSLSKWAGAMLVDRGVADDMINTLYHCTIPSGSQHVRAVTASCFFNSLTQATFFVGLVCTGHAK